MTGDRQASILNTVPGRRRIIGIGFRCVLLGLVVLLFTACATIDNPDPYEGINRKVMAFNDGADKWILNPIVNAYTTVIPEPVRRSVHNFYDNLTYPTVILNQFLQGKGTLGFSDLGRFLINTTLGIGGLFDVATKFGLEPHKEDFGQTLAVWGVPNGAYLVTPLWGPVTTRSGIGDIAGAYTYPVNLVDDVSTRNALLAGWIIDTRATYQEVEALITGDRYLFIRDAFLQQRDFLVNDGQVETDPFLEQIE